MEVYVITDSTGNPVEVCLDYDTGRDALRELVLEAKADGLGTKYEMHAVPFHAAGQSGTEKAERMLCEAIAQAELKLAKYPYTTRADIPANGSILIWGQYKQQWRLLVAPANEEQATTKPLCECDSNLQVAASLVIIKMEQKLIQHHTNRHDKLSGAISAFRKIG